MCPRLPFEAGQPLFPEPDAQAKALLEGYIRVLSRVRPLKAKHAKSLPEDIFKLSRTLTAERGELESDYLTAPGPLSAYLSYFLPWNLWRMVRLFQGLGLDLPEGGRVVDVGAGPLTVAQALWMALPALRPRRLSVTCLDRTPKPMREGLALMDALRHGRDDARVWSLNCRTGGPFTRLEQRADLVVCANTLNELPLDEKGLLLDRVEETGRALLRMLTPGGRILVIEPGTRRSGRILSLLRDVFLEEGLRPLSPCPHAGPCPFPAEGGKGWCHFTFEAHTAPAWLRSLAAKAGLAKNQASLSFLYFANDGESPTEGDFDDDEAERTPMSEMRIGGEEGLVRVLSAPFALPGGLRGRYGCCGQGAALLTWPEASPVLLHPGDLVRPPRLPEGQTPPKDPKTGAVILPLIAAQAQAPAQAPAEAPAAAPRKTPAKKPSERPADKPTGNSSDKHSGKPKSRTTDKRSEHGDKKAERRGPGAPPVRGGQDHPGKSGGAGPGRGRRNPFPGGAPGRRDSGKKGRSG